MPAPAGMKHFFIHLEKTHLHDGFTAPPKAALPSLVHAALFRTITDHIKRRPVAAPTSEALHNLKQFCARSTLFHAIFYYIKKRPVAAPISEPLYKMKLFRARSTFFRVISYMIKKLRKQLRSFLFYSFMISVTRSTSPSTVNLTL